MSTIGERAVVLGASMGGLLAARVLAEFYESVTVVERDMLPDNAVHRRGVPQGRHVHALLGRGSQVLGDLFPGIREELVAAGAPVLDYRDLSEGFISFAGHRLVRSGRFRDVPAVHFPSRPLLESVVRRRVCAMTNIAFREGCDVVDLIATQARDRVAGARVHTRDADEVLTADLVVDATGRGSRTPVFLDTLGYGRPREDRVAVNLVYSSQLLRIPPGTLHELAAIVSPVPGRPTGLALFGYEDDTRMFTVFGMAGREPPHKADEMLSFAEGLAPSHVLAAIGAAEPLTEVCRFRYPESRWRRYDRMPAFPSGLLVFGDAFCSFNPVYGQGMTVAALQARALDNCLRRGGANGLARRFFRAAAKPVGVAWHLAVGGDLSLPEVEGPRPLSSWLASKYIDQLQTATETDIVVAEAFTKVVGLLEPPTRLLHPRIVARVAREHLRRRCRVRGGTGAADAVAATAG